MNKLILGVLLFAVLQATNCSPDQSDKENEMKKEVTTNSNPASAETPASSLQQNTEETKEEVKAEDEKDDLEKEIDDDVKDDDAKDDDAKDDDAKDDDAKDDDAKNDDVKDDDTKDDAKDDDAKDDDAKDDDAKNDDVKDDDAKDGDVEDDDVKDDNIDDEEEDEVQDVDTKDDDAKDGNVEDDVINDDDNKDDDVNDDDNKNNDVKDDDSKDDDVKDEDKEDLDNLSDDDVEVLNGLVKPEEGSVAIQTYGVRLVNGGRGRPYQGRVEVYYRGRWGTVCDDYFGIQDANVICRYLGYNGAIAAYQRARFGQGRGPIWFDDMHCTGREASPFLCRKNPIGRHNCRHYEDASVVCRTPRRLVRLVNGRGRFNQGRVEVLYRGRWGTVCDDYFDIRDANVICRYLGYRYGALAAYHRARFGRGSGPIWMDDMQCTGRESNPFLCRKRLGSHNCGHHEDASVVCRTRPPRLVRLVNGRGRRNQGRVEVFYRGRWGTVCDDYFDLRDANVICRYLGYRYGASAAYHGARFGRGSGPIWFDDMHCTGRESNPFLCRKRLGSHNCGHHEDASVVCRTGPVVRPADAVRLVNGRTFSRHFGRVEVFVNGRWGTVCDDGFGIQEARVICRQLGYCNLGRVRAYSRARYGRGTVPIMLDDLACTGRESDIRRCRSRRHGTHNCGHHEDASVRCF